jgi:membrane-associated phospholipid phosphatase
MQYPLNCLKPFLWLILIMFSFSHLQAQDSTTYTGHPLSTQNYYPDKQFNLPHRIGKDVPKLANSTVRNFGKVATSPVQWDSKSWLKFGAVTALGTTAVIFDDQINNFFLNNTSNTTAQISRFAEPFGNHKYVGLPLLATWSLGMGLKNENLIQTAYDGFEAVLISSLITGFLKASSQRARPYQEKGNFDFYGEAYSFSSAFPSNHTSLSFALARVVSERFDGKLVAPIAYSIASITALSRMHDQKHWASDVIIGAAIGYFTAGKVLKLRENKNISLVVYPSLVW